MTRDDYTPQDFAGDNPEVARACRLRRRATRDTFRTLPTLRAQIDSFLGVTSPTEQRTPKSLGLDLSTVADLDADPDALDRFLNA